MSLGPFAGIEVDSGRARKIPLFPALLQNSFFLDLWLNFGDFSLQTFSIPAFSAEKPPGKGATPEILNSSRLKIIIFHHFEIRFRCAERAIGMKAHISHQSGGDSAGIQWSVCNLSLFHEHKHGSKPKYTRPPTEPARGRARRSPRGGLSRA